MWLVRVAGPPPGCGWSHVPHSRIKFPGQVPVCTGCSAQGVQGVHIVYRVFILQGCTTCRGFPSLSTGVQHCLGCTCHCTALYCTVLYGVVTRPGYDHCSMNGPRYAACSLQHCSTLTVSLSAAVVTPWASAAAWRCPSPAPPCCWARGRGRGRGRPPPPPSAAAGGSTQTLQHGEHVNMIYDIWCH